MAGSLIAIAAAAGVAAAATVRRARTRAAQAERRWPPEGEFVTLGSVRMHVVVRGDGPDVVLIHGAAGSSRDFTFRLADRLAATYRVLAIDRPGHGFSATCDDSDRLAVQAQFIRQTAAVMGAAKPVVVGHSYGSAVALRWAIDAPSTVSGIVAVAAVSHPWPGPLPLFYRLSSHPVMGEVFNHAIAAWAPEGRITDSVASVFDPDPVPQGYIAHFGPLLSARVVTLRENARQRRILKSEVADMVPLYGRIRAPVEILHGDRDTTVGLDHHARALAGDLPDARLTVLHGHGHMPHHFEEDAVGRAVGRILDAAALPSDRD